MKPEFTEALIALLIGMTTVFIVLGIVVLTGQLLIRLVNRFAPVAPPLRTASTNSTELEASKMAALVAAVELVTQGKGKINQIKKLDQL